MSFIDNLKDFYKEVKKREYKAQIKEITEKYLGKRAEKNNKEEKNFLDSVKKVFNDKYEMYFAIKEIISTIVFVIVAVILIREFVGELRIIPSASMRNTIIEGDRVFVQKRTNWGRNVQRGDIIVFYPPDEELKNDVWSVLARLTGIFCKDIAYIKRVVAVGGDKYEIKVNNKGESYVYINDVKMEEPYIISHKNWLPCKEGMHCGPLIVPQNHYFMMGDNRGNSLDSRYWGMLSADRIIGRATVLFWPLNRIRKF